MPVNFFPALAYVLISTFTPGPSNISSASMAILHGYKKTLKYQLGLAVGVFLMMALSGWLSAALLNAFPTIEPILRYVGAGYILYLALGILKASYNFSEEDMRPLAFVHGLMLQILNPKLVVYAFTLFSLFLSSVNLRFVPMILLSASLAAISFCSTSTWALFGTLIRNHLRNPRLQFSVNLLLSLLLVYTALSLVGIFSP